MMNSATQYAAFARMLDLNNRIHDLQQELGQVVVPLGDYPEEAWFEVVALGRVARLQDKIDRETRASIVTCWLGMPDAREE
ncbi:MAG: hypothetical protein FJ316_02505 [SAR202 cluster bacterium]|nr:hypothetical protein [SAR202 cluster bacterium]